MNSDPIANSQEVSGLPMEDLMGGPLMAASKANAAMALTQTRFMLDTCFEKKHVEAREAIKGAPAVIDPITKLVITPEVVGSPAIPAHDNYIPVMIVMSLTRGVITPGSPAVPKDPNDPASKEIPATATQIQSVVTEFNLPLLTIVPLNSLAVDTVDVNFNMEVISSTSEKRASQGTDESSVEAKIASSLPEVTIKGFASYDAKDPLQATDAKNPTQAHYTISMHASQLPLPKGVNTIIEAFAQSISPITLGS